MSDAVEELAHLKAMYERTILLKEGGRPVALLPAFSFTAAGHGETMDLLLVPFAHSGYTTRLLPFAHSGYTTRLFFERRIDGRGSNWTEHRVVDHNWWAPSWNNIPESTPWPEMLRAHLRAVV